MVVETLAFGFGLVEGPTVDASGGLLFSDVLGGGVYRLDAAGQISTVVPKRRGVGGLALHADGGVVASGRDIVHVRDGETRTLFRIDGLPGWNDLCTDHAGRVYAGALRFPVFDPEAQPIPGELWRVERERHATRLYGDLVHPNGVALSPDERTIYHSDTRSHAVVVHDLLDDGTAANRRQIDTSAVGQPDGLAVDTNGCVWVACLGTGVARFTPEGKLDRVVTVAASIVTNVCFGGDDRRELYVVTGDNSDEPKRRGTIFRTRVDVSGALVDPARL